jgi:tight adherence protein C
MFERAGVVKLSGTSSLTLMLVFAAIGYYLPNAILALLTRRRQREIFEAFPDAIDLMIVCVEAGLGLDMAINRAAEEMKLRSPELTEELDLMALELRIGASRERALRNFATRTGLDEVSTFVTMLLQADRFGTSLAESLRVHADSLRTRRRLLAEEAAAKIPLKLLFPLIFFIFPSLLLVLLGPAMIQIHRIMLPALSGGQ